MINLDILVNNDNVHQIWAIYEDSYGSQATAKIWEKGIPTFSSGLQARAFVTFEKGSDTPIFMGDQSLSSWLSNIWAYRFFARQEKIDILFEDENYFVVSKPPHMITQYHGEADPNNSLVVYMQKWSELSGLRPAHSLDFDTGGLLLVPKHQDVYDFTREYFSSIAVQKQYLLLAHNIHDIPATGEINEHLLIKKTQKIKERPI